MIPLKETIEKLIKNDEEDAINPAGRGISKPKEVAIKLSDFKGNKYPMSRVHMGYFLIFNQERFKKGHPYNRSPREGSSVDAKKLQERGL